MPSPSDSQAAVRLLPPDVINKIAAGEVVDRPASVLKELLENAIDAGARQIDVHLDNGGRKRICVADDGTGMRRDDALLSIERHATSKIRQVDDIEQIGTLGFRGEALAAIAAVSRFRLRTAVGDGHPGTDISVFGGTLRDVSETGFPRGTTLEVRDLFFNVPARRKFLRTPQTELAHARQVFIVHALAHPDIGLRLMLDDRPTLELAAGETLEQRLHALFGGDLVRMLRPVALSNDHVRLQGYVGIPPEGRRDRGLQFYFVNGRPAGAPLIGYAVRESYHSLLPRDRHPPVILFIDTDPGQVDVNVHPQKREVRFRDPTRIRDTIQQGIGAALRSAQSRFEIPGARLANRPSPAVTPDTTVDSPELRLDYPRRTSTGHSPDDAGGQTTGGGDTSPPRDGALTDSTRGTNAVAPPDSPWQFARVVGQVGGLFVLLETEDGLVIMDPHAAHERVLFDRYMHALQAGRPNSQELLMPVTVSLPPIEAAALKPHLHQLHDLGFGVHEFGEDGFMVDAVPEGFTGMSPKDWIVMLVADFKRDGSGRRLPRGPQEETIAKAACRAAVKAHQRLTPAEIEQLVTDLAATEMPYTCPHGRPILLNFPFTDLHQRFGR